METTYTHRARSGSTEDSGISQLCARISGGLSSDRRYAAWSMNHIIASLAPALSVPTDMNVALVFGAVLIMLVKWPVCGMKVSEGHGRRDGWGLTGPTCVRN